MSNLTDFFPSSNLATAGTAATAVRGLAGFDEDNFTVVNGFVNLQASQSYWLSLSTGFHIEPALTTALAEGDVYNYIYLNEDTTLTTYYRYIKTDGTLDAFYSGFDGTDLTGFIVQKEIILP